MLCPQEEAGVGRGLVTEGLFSLFCALPQREGDVDRGAFTGQQAEVGGLSEGVFQQLWERLRGSAMLLCLLTWRSTLVFYGRVSSQDAMPSLACGYEAKPTIAMKFKGQACPQQNSSPS